jgi:hypothetical protein
MFPARIGTQNRDNRATMSTEEATNARYLALAKAVDQTWLRTRDTNFADTVQEYRRVEADFITAAGDEPFVLETKRRIAEAILQEAQEQTNPSNRAKMPGMSCGASASRTLK